MNEDKYALNASVRQAARRASGLGSGAPLDEGACVSRAQALDGGALEVFVARSLR